MPIPEKRPQMISQPTPGHKDRYASAVEADHLSVRNKLVNVLFERLPVEPSDASVPERVRWIAHPKDNPVPVALGRKAMPGDTLQYYLNISTLEQPDDDPITYAFSDLSTRVRALSGGHEDPNPDKQQFLRDVVEDWLISGTTSNEMRQS